MNITRLWGLLSIVVVVAVAAFGYFVGVQPQLDEAASANEQRVEVENQNALQEIELARLQAEAENLPALRAALEEARRSVPAQANLSSFLQQLSDLAAAAGVSVASFNSQDALGFVPAEALADQMPGGLSDQQFIVIPVQVEVAGTRDGVLDFIERVQTGERLFLVSDLRLDRDGEDPVAARGSLTGLIYVLLDEVGGSVDDEAADDAEVGATE